MEILTANIIGSYSYKSDIEIASYKKDHSYTKECVICKRSLFEPSYEMMSDNKNILSDTEIVIGKCGHIFHGDCLGKWLSTCRFCPIDKVEWCLHRVADTTTKLVINNSNNLNTKKHYTNQYNKNKHVNNQ